MTSAPLSLLTRNLAILADLIMPLTCAGCGEWGGSACPACLAELYGPESHGPDLLAAAGPLATPRRRGLPPCLAAGSYAGRVRALVLAYKEEGRLDLALPLGRALARTVARAVPGARSAPGGPGSVGPRAPGRRVTLVPVPSTPSALRRRGFNPLARLCAVAVSTLRRTGFEVQVAPVLRPVRRTRDQARLGAAARAANLAGAFELVDPARVSRLMGAVPVGRGGIAGGRPPGSPEDLPGGLPAIVVVDDIFTTGATAGEAVRALRAGRWPTLAVAVVAATAPPGSTRGLVRLPAVGVPQG